MNTGTRRFILRLAVALLTFLLGVTAAWALGGFNPFQSSSGTRYYRYTRSGSYPSGSLMAEPGVVYPIYRKHGHGCKAPRELGELPPPPPPPMAR